MPPGALPCRLGGWGETIPFSKKPSLRLTWRWAALFLLCFPLKVEALRPAGLSKSEVPPRLCLERSLFLLWKQSISVNYQPSPEDVDQVTTEKDPEQGHPGEKAQPGCAPRMGASDSCHTSHAESPILDHGFLLGGVSWHYLTFCFQTDGAREESHFPCLFQKFLEHFSAG